MDCQRTKPGGKYAPSQQFAYCTGLCRSALLAMMPPFVLPGARLRPLLLLVLPLPALAQAPADTARAVALPGATVTGYGQQLPLRRTAAAVGVLDARMLEQFSPTALTQAVNTLPGVRLEERATASYRLSIRGSTLRSPFGVRNVKVYYNGLPFTDAGGSTPLNLLDPALVGRLEVLKGPAGSVYGAGTGGVARFETPAVAAGTGRVAAAATVGSYGLRRSTVVAEVAGPGSSVRAQYAHQSLAGYREQSALRRDVLALDLRTTAAPRTTLAVHLLYADIDYQLPGGLTRAQFAADPRQARPGTAAAPGTVAQQAAYASRTGLLGVHPRVPVQRQARRANHALRQRLGPAHAVPGRLPAGHGRGRRRAPGPALAHGPGRPGAAAARRRRVSGQPGQRAQLPERGRHARRAALRRRHYDRHRLLLRAGRLRIAGRAAPDRGRQLQPPALPHCPHQRGRCHPQRLRVRARFPAGGVAARGAAARVRPRPGRLRQPEHRLRAPHHRRNPPLRRQPERRLTGRARQQLRGWARGASCWASGWATT